MNIDQLRKLCLSFPAVTEEIQWEDNLLFKVAGKMFAIAPLEPARLWLTLKADPNEFLELTERPGIVPAPYLARAKWIAIETSDTLPQSEVAALLRNPMTSLSPTFLAKLANLLRTKSRRVPNPNRRVALARAKRFARLSSGVGTAVCGSPGSFRQLPWIDPRSVRARL